MMRAIFGVSVADAAILAILLRSQSDRMSDFFIVFYPVIFLVALALWITHASFRQGILVLEGGYSVFVAVIILRTFFGGEQDAGYQLLLLIIPVMGLLAVLVAGVAALSVRLKRVPTKQSD